MTFRTFPPVRGFDTKGRRAARVSIVSGWGAGNIADSLANHFKVDNSQEYEDDANLYYTDAREATIQAALDALEVAGADDYDSDTLMPLENGIMEMIRSNFELRHNWPNN